MNIPGATYEAMLTALVAALNDDTGTPSVEIYTGAMPDEFGAPPPGTFLGVVDLPKPVGTITENVVTFAPVVDEPTAVATGVPGWCRFMTGEGAEAFYMTAGGPESDAEVIFNASELSSGEPVVILSVSIALNRGPVPAEEPGGGGGEVDPTVLATSLLSALLHWYDFDDVSGGFTDAHGSSDLTIVDSGGAADAATYGATGGNPGRKFNPMATSNSPAAYSPLPGIRPPAATFSFGCWITRNDTGYVNAANAIGWIGGNSEGGIASIQLVGPVPDYYVSAQVLDDVLDGYAPEVTLPVASGDRILAVATVNFGAQRIEIRARGALGGAMQYAQAAFAASLNPSSTVNFAAGNILDNDTLSPIAPDSELTMIDGGFVATIPMTNDLFDYLFNAGNGIDYAQLVADAA